RQGSFPHFAPRCTPARRVSCPGLANQDEGAGMSTDSNSIGVVIVSYGHEQDVADLVESFAGQLRDSERVVVVDNRKPWLVESVVGERLRAHGEHNVTIINHDNGGFAAGCNIGAASIQDEVDLLFFLNPDTVIEDPTLFDTLRRVDDQWA